MIKFFNDLKKFIKDTASDDRIPLQDKKILIALVALIISPIDLIPDWIPFFGILDDLVLFAIVLDYFFSVLDDHILLSHYPWGMKSYVKVRALAKFFSSLVPKFIRKKLWTYVKSPY